MIITRCPLRISLFGGGSDVQQFINNHGYALCISAAINKYSYITVKKLLPFHPYKTKITYDQIERVDDNREIQHKVFQSCLEFSNLLDEPLEINFVSDLPGYGLGLGSSASMIVNLLYALDRYKLYTYGEMKYDNFYSMNELWLNAHHVEKNILNEVCGYQDYWPAIFGNIQEYRFNGNNFKTTRLAKKLRRLIDKFGLLFYTNSRNSSVVLSKYIGSIAASQEQLKIRDIAEKALEEIFGKCDIYKLGEMIYDSWSLKKSLSPEISTPLVEDLETALANAGCFSFKLCGSGGGGSVFCMADPIRHIEVIETATKLGCIHIPFQVSCNGIEEIY